jgi:hypothetical protein
MDDARLVGVLQRREDLSGDAGRSPGLERAFGG